MNSRKFLIPLLLMILLGIFAPTMVEARVNGRFNWKYPGGNPSSLGLLAITNLNVPEDVKEGWEDVTPDIVWVKNGIFLNELTEGGERPGTIPKVDHSVYCDWQTFDSLQARRYSYAIINNQTIGDNIKVTETVYVLYHFFRCNNIGWFIQVHEKYSSKPKPLPPPVQPPLTKLLPPPNKVVVEIVREKITPVFIPIIPKAECLMVELENFNSIGWIGNYPYVNTGDRVIYYPVCSKVLGLSGKGFYGWQASYDPLAHPGDFSFHGLNNTTGWKLGLRLEPIPLMIFYLNAGKSWYEGKKGQGLDTELECLLIRGKWKLGLTFFKLALTHTESFWAQGQIVDSVPAYPLQLVVTDPGYFWDRVRIEYLIGHRNDGDIYVGAEFFHEGGGRTFKPDYMYQRGGILVEYFKPWNRSNWLSVIGEVGYGSFGPYIGLEFCMGFQYFRHKTNR